MLEVTAAVTPKGERRRYALVSAAADLLCEGGFDAVRHRAVARRAGLPLASTTYYFSSLDDLIARYGEPRFVKIDVEGAERDVLDGLTRPLVALSFEYIPVAVDRAVACVERLDQLGPYRYRYSRAETMQWACADWLDAAGLMAELRAMPLSDRSGDVYARLVR